MLKTLAMLRLFAALPVPPEVSGALLKLQKNLPGAHWRPQENFHITLCFYGEVSDTAARDCAGRWLAAGREVGIAEPEPGRDWNDEAAE